MSEKKTTTLVVIPYAPGKAQGWELKTSVHGWRKYFQGDAHIVTIGERSEMVDILLGEGALSEHIERPVPSVYPFERPRELEFAAIARFIIERFGKEYSGFVKTDDDIYPINPFTLADVKRPKWVNNELTGDADKSAAMLSMMAGRVFPEAQSIALRSWKRWVPVMSAL